MDNNLFDDGWRDPGDDGERAGVYVLMAGGFLFGPLMLWFAWTLFFGKPTGSMPPAGIYILGALATVIGIAVPAGAFLFFRSESKHWQLKKMTADRFIAGGMLAGIGLIWLAFQLHQPGYGGGQGNTLYGAFAFILGGAAVFLVFLAIGLIIAFWPVATKKLSNVKVVGRFALDDKLQEIPGAVGPFESGWTPVVIVQTSQGENRKLAATETAYEMTYLDAVGTASIKGKRLVRFQPRLKDPARMRRA